MPPKHGVANSWCHNQLVLSHWLYITTKNIQKHRGERVSAQLDLLVKLRVLSTTPQQPELVPTSELR